MAKNFLVPIDLNKQELRNARMQNLASAPASPVAGQSYFDTTLMKPRIWNGTIWEDMVGADGTVTGVTGTLPIRSSGGATPDISIDAATTTAPGSMSAADKTKLDGVAAGATANSTDAFLLDRANHTGTQAAATISDFTEAAQDAVGASLLDTATLNLTYDDVANTISGAVLDSPTVGGATPAQLRDRATHTGTQAASTISDFHTAVRTNRLDQMAIPGAALNINGYRITGVGAPTADGDAATKAYVDGVASGLDIKASVRVASTANIALATGGLLTIDGVTLAAGDRVLVKNQTTAAENGIYVAAAGAWTRAPDADTSTEVTSGMFTFVEQGTANSDTGWVLTTDGPVTLGTTVLTFAQFSGAGTYTAGNGLSLTGTSFAVQPVSGGGVAVGAGGVSVDPAVVARKYSGTLGDGTATSFVLTHNLNTRGVVVSVYLNSGAYEEVEVDVEKTSLDSVTLRFATAPTAGQYAFAIVG